MVLNSSETSLPFFNMIHFFISLIIKWSVLIIDRIMINKLCSLNLHDRPQIAETLRHLTFTYPFLFFCSLSLWWQFWLDWIGLFPYAFTDSSWEYCSKFSLTIHPASKAPFYFKLSSNLPPKTCCPLTSFWIQLHFICQNQEHLRKINLSLIYSVTGNKYRFYIGLLNATPERINVWQIHFFLDTEMELSTVL